MNIDTDQSGETELWAELERAAVVPAVSERALHAARAAVREAALTETLRAEALRADTLRLRRRRRVRIGAVVAGAVAASMLLGLTRLELGGHQVGATSAAAAVLERAADATLAQSDLTPGPGQFLRVRLVERSWTSFADDAGKVLVGDDGRAALTQEERTRTLWIPQDGTSPMTVREGTTALRSNSNDRRFQARGEATRTWRQPNWSLRGTRGYLKTYDPQWYATLPRDPAKLMAALRGQSGAEGSGTDYDFAEIYSEVLRSGIAPADIRAALFTGLARTPGIRLDDDVRTLDGRKGVAISSGSKSGYSWGMVFDAGTGRYIGERATTRDFPAVPGVDADRTTWLTSVTTEVVDSAPRARP